MDKEIFIVSTPDDNEGGAYTLLVSRGTPFAGAMGTAVFYVDKLVENADPSGRITSFTGMKNDDSIVAMFPVGTAFLMTRRQQVRALTSIEYHLEEKEASKKLEEALADPDTPAKEAPKMPGQYV